MEASVALQTVESPTMGALSVRQLTEQVQLIQQVMRAVMKNGEHYGVIEGTDKPTLLKPGAEKLCLTFRFAPEYEATLHTTLREDFIFWDIRCRLVHIQTGQLVGTGMGSCSSREEKYAYRKAARKCPSCGKAAIIQGKPEYGGGWVCYKKKEGCGAKFKDGDQAIESQPAGKVPNENIWDLGNTIEKMACKRALVAAVLNATAASDIFTQDMEDFQENGTTTQGRPSTPQPEGRPATIGRKGELELLAWADENKVARPHVKNTAVKHFQIQNMQDLTPANVEWLKAHLKRTATEPGGQEPPSGVTQTPDPPLPDQGQAENTQQAEAEPAQAEAPKKAATGKAKTCLNEEGAKSLVRFGEQFHVGSHQLLAYVGVEYGVTDLTELATDAVPAIKRWIQDQAKG